MIAVLVSPRQRGLDLLDALGDELVGECLVVTGGPVPAGADRAAVSIRVEDYTTTTIVEAVLGTGLEIDRVVSFAEADLLAAAQLRDRLELPGQRGTSALAYRDKAMMRRYCGAAGLPTPRYATVDSAAEVLAFARDHPFPLVLKPRMSSGSVGVRVLRSADDIGVVTAGHLVEEFVEGEVVHVDGLVVDGVPVFALPAAYTELGCLAHLSDQGSGSYLLSRDHPWHRPLVDELWRVVQALPGAPDLLLHAEFFVEPGRRPVLCEIASRMPGHPIPPMLDRALGHDLRRAWLRVGAGLPVDMEELRRAADVARPVANFGLPPLDGTLVSLPAAPALEWLHDYEVLARPGSTPAYAERKSGDFVLTWTVSAADASALQERLRISAELLEAQVVWR